MLVGVLIWILVFVIIVFVGIGVISVYKVVYIDKCDLKCVCVGGDSNVLLGFVLLFENVMMVGMVIWMMVKLI